MSLNVPSTIKGNVLICFVFGCTIHFKYWLSGLYTHSPCAGNCLKVLMALVFLCSSLYNRAFQWRNLREIVVWYLILSWNNFKNLSTSTFDISTWMQCNFYARQLNFGIAHWKLLGLRGVQFLLLIFRIVLMPDFTRACYTTSSVEWRLRIEVELEGSILGQTTSLLFWSTAKNVTYK